VLSVGDDALVLADALGWDRFALLGVSGGGPHALAIAYRAPERTRALGLAVSMVPAELVDPDELIAINREGRERLLAGGRAGLGPIPVGPKRVGRLVLS
jgi:pimeloyl-ACP methyl ester carboxylesterase